jgi:hypothetical protein
MTLKGKWLLLFFIDNLLFFTALAIDSLPMYFFVIALSFYIYKNGRTILFKEYDERKKRKLAEYQLVQEAVKKTIRTSRLFKKEKEL